MWAWGRTRTWTAVWWVALLLLVMGGETSGAPVGQLPRRDSELQASPSQTPQLQLQPTTASGDLGSAVPSAAASAGAIAGIGIAAAFVGFAAVGSIVVRRRTALKSAPKNFTFVPPPMFINPENEVCVFGSVVEALYLDVTSDLAR
ncbi:hypothetical protein HK100_004233 [Physocladia obscura]|uniref:Uncharacterized protein n=1 Tax=Physocladia obscura TaxID=109957 RepID=A0AAD5STA9_9FUNG|nr:hypothetical protein HK100_004233 [Physocladia obscura]